MPTPNIHVCDLLQSSAPCWFTAWPDTSYLLSWAVQRKLCRPAGGDGTQIHRCVRACTGHQEKEKAQVVVAGDSCGRRAKIPSVLLHTLRTAHGLSVVLFGVCAARGFVVCVFLALLALSLTMLRAQLSDSQLELPVAALDRFEGWLANVTAQQAEADPTAEPVFTEAQVKAKKNSIKGQLNYLKRIPKPTPTPKPSPAADKKSADKEKAKAGAEDTEADAQQDSENAEASKEDAATEQQQKEESKGSAEEPASEGTAGDAEQPSASEDGSSSTASEDEL